MIELSAATEIEWASTKGRAARLKGSDPIEAAKLEIEKDATNLTKWDKLFQILDEKFTELYTEDKSQIDEGFKQTVYESYQLLLTRFPYLVRYWISWQIFEFKLSGVDKSIDILSKSVQSFPTSIELWVEYLNALITQVDWLKKHDQVEFIRLQYIEAIKYNGYNYNGHPLWDKIIEFETLVDDSSEVLLNLYLMVIKIPLYQYSQYYKQFAEINKKFDINKVLPHDELHSYVVKFNKSKPQELSMIERHQIIDDYMDKISVITQLQVLAKWNFESTITNHEFLLEILNENPDYTTWIQYLDFELDSFKQGKSCQQSVANLFERALIPNCYNSRLWLKYLAFVSSLQSEDKFDIAKNIYLRAMNIIPLLDTLVRVNFAKFLVKYNKFEECLEFLIGMLSELKNNRIYLKKPFLESLQFLLNVIYIKLREHKFEKLLHIIIERYFDKKEKGIEKLLSDDVLTDADEDPLKPSIDLLPRLINNDSICVIILLYLNTILASKVDNKTLILRKFYNRYSNEHALKSSISFWKFFVEFEGLINYNLTNLNNVMFHVKTKTCLPQVVIESLIDLHYDILSANLNLCYSTGPHIVDPILKRDNDISKSFVHNQFIKKRLSSNLVTKEAKALKTNNVEEEILKIAKGHSFHPGIFVDKTPDITNKFVKLGHWVNLNEDNLSVPPFPMFKNVEKASLPINFPSE